MPATLTPTAQQLQQLLRAKDLAGLRGLAVIEAIEEANKPEPIAGELTRSVPLINKVAAGYPSGFTDLAYPARHADEYVQVPDCPDPDLFAARVVGDSMEPEYFEGDVVVFSPAAAVKDGADCFVRLEPDHDTTFKRVFFESDGDGLGRIRLQPLNSSYPSRTVPREEVAGLYAVMFLLRDKALVTRVTA